MFKRTYLVYRLGLDNFIDNVNLFAQKNACWRSCSNFEARERFRRLLEGTSI